MDTNRPHDLVDYEAMRRQYQDEIQPFVEYMTKLYQIGTSPRFTMYEGEIIGTEIVWISESAKALHDTMKAQVENIRMRYETQCQLKYQSS